MRLNLGCANDLKQGYINVDLYHSDPSVRISDVKNLDWIDNETVDEIYARDVLEHLSFEEGSVAIQEWSRVLKKGASFYIQTIDISLQIKAFQDGIWSLPDLNHMLFAGTGWVDGISRQQDFHKSAYTSDYLISLLEKFNLKIIKLEKDAIDQALSFNPRSHNLNMSVWGVKC